MVVYLNYIATHYECERNVVFSGRKRTLNEVCAKQVTEVHVTSVAKQHPHIRLIQLEEVLTHSIH